MGEKLSMVEIIRLKNMIKVLLVQIVLAFVWCTAFSQDKIVLRNGNEITGKVIEITINEVKYKKQENLQGPLISILKEDVYSIKYENGTTDFINHENKTAQSIKKDDPDKVSTVIYGGVSLPIGQFKDKNIGAALTGFTAGLDVSIKTKLKSLCFNYCINYVGHPVEGTLPPPNNQITIKARYDIGDVLIGVRWQTPSPRFRFYASVVGGFNFTFIDGRNIQSVEGIGFAFHPSIGICMKRITVALKYFSANPNLQLTDHNERISIRAFQAVVGIRLN